MRMKLGGQMNMGIDPEILAIGTEMAAFHIEAGARKFADYAKKMIEDLGDAIRPISNHSTMAQENYQR